MPDHASDLGQGAADALSNAVRTAFVGVVKDAWKEYKHRSPTVGQMLADRDVLCGYPLGPRIATFLLPVQETFNDLLKLVSPQRANEIAWATIRKVFPFDAFQESQVHPSPRFPVGDNGRKFSVWISKGFKRYLPENFNEKGLFARAVWHLLPPFREETEQIFSRSTSRETVTKTKPAATPSAKPMADKPAGKPRSERQVDPENAKR